MESLKKSLEDLTGLFNSRMTDFQKDLKNSMPAASPTSNINAQFLSFRSFVLNALESLQLQVQLLANQQDEMETRSRRKILLVHGFSGDGKDTKLSITKFLSEKLKVSVTEDSITLCRHLGTSTGDKPRPLIIKFKDLSLRNKIWFAKINLKGSGVTLSEFLTRRRHEAFVAARKRFGVAKCWSRDGYVTVLTPDGTRNRILSLADLNAIPDPIVATVSSAAVTTVASVMSRDARSTSRAKKPARK